MNEITKETIKDLENKRLQFTERNVILCSQGYFVNNDAQFKLCIIDMLIGAFKHIDIFSNKQRSALERIYNTISTL